MQTWRYYSALLLCVFLKLNARIIRMMSIRFLLVISPLIFLLSQEANAQTLPPDLTAEKPKMYRIYGRPKKGTKFKHVEAEFPVPLTKRYADLTPEQQEIYKRIYVWLSGEGLKKDQTPPFPEAGLESIYKPIIRKNLLVAKNKVLFFIADINEEGIAEEVTIYSSPNREFNEFVNTLMFATKFDPATCDGEPCAMKFPFEIDLRYVDRNSDIQGALNDGSWQSDQPQ